LAFYLAKMEEITSSPFHSPFGRDDLDEEEDVWFWLGHYSRTREVFLTSYFEKCVGVPASALAVVTDFAKRPPRNVRRMRRVSLLDKILPAPPRSSTSTSTSSQHTHRQKKSSLAAAGPPHAGSRGEQR